MEENPQGLNSTLSDLFVQPTSFPVECKGYSSDRCSFFCKLFLWSSVCPWQKGFSFETNYTLQLQINRLNKTQISVGHTFYEFLKAYLFVRKKPNNYDHNAQLMSEVWTDHKITVTRRMKYSQPNTWKFIVRSREHKNQNVGPSLGEPNFQYPMRKYVEEAAFPTLCIYGLVVKTQPYFQHSLANLILSSSFFSKHLKEKDSYNLY